MFSKNILEILFKMFTKKNFKMFIKNYCKKSTPKKFCIQKLRKKFLKKFIK